MVLSLAKHFISFSVVGIIALCCTSTSLFAQIGDHMLKGEIIAIDAASESITIKTDDGSTQTFSPVKASFLLIDSQPAQFSDMQLGMHATVSYYLHGGSEMEIAWVEINTK